MDSAKTGKKIVRIIARLNTGGPARHVVWLTEAMPSSEFDSVLVAGTVPEGEEDMSYFAAEHGVEPIFIPEMSRELSPKDAVSLWKVYRLLRRENPDIIDTHTAKAGTIGRSAGFLYRWLTLKTLIGRPRRVRFIHTYHGHVFHSYYGKLKTNFFLLIEKTLAKLATDKIIVISEQQKNEINDRFGVGKNKQFAIIPCGIDLSPYKDWQLKRKLFREEIGCGENEIIVGIVGRLTEIKNHSMFLRAAKLYQDAKKNDGKTPQIRFIVIGDGNLREKLESEAGKLNIEETVTFLGNRRDADVFHAGLDIEALTSLNEGTPFSLIEGMASARPCLATGVGGVVDLLGAVEKVEDGFTVCERGIRVASNDVDAFCKGLIYLAKNEKLRNEMGNRGKDFVFANYAKERLIADMKQIYRDLTR